MKSILQHIHLKHFIAALVVVGLCAFLATTGHTLQPEALLAFGALPLMLGETDNVGEIANLIKQQGTAFEEFKRTNDELIKAKADGKAVSDLEAKLAKINEDFARLNAEHTEIMKKANRPEAGAVSEQARAEYKQALNQFARGDDLSGLVGIHKKAMNSGTDPEGGYLVLPELDRIIDRVAPTISAMYRNANVVTVGSNKYMKMVKTSGMTAVWPGEGNTGGETTEPLFAEVGIEAWPVEVEPWVHNTTLEDAFIDLEADLTDEAAISFAAGEGAKFITGNGIASPRGIAGYSNVANSSYAWGSVGYIASGKAGAFMSSANAPADRMIQLQHALKQQYRPGAVWMMNDATLGAVRQLKDGSGQYYLWQPDPAAGFGGRLLGSPVEVDDNFADIGANAYALAYGNFKRAYTIVRRSGVKLIRDPYTAKGKTKFNFTRRTGGGITNYEALKLMRFATS